MSIFDIFRSKKVAKNNSDNVTQGNEQNQLKKIDQALFVDNEKPEIAIEDQKQLSPLDEFLNQNFESMGYNDGYFYPDNEYLIDKLKLIRADFRLTIDKSFDAKRSEIGELKLHIIRVKDILPTLESQLNEKLKLLEACLHELDIQKILSVENEGIVSSAIHSYNMSFKKGVARYYEEKSIGQCTGLFNK